MKIQEVPVGVKFTIRVQPRSARDELAGEFGDSLKLRVTAPPVDGAANEASLVLLAEKLGVPSGQVSIVSGHKSKLKTVLICGLSVEEVTARLKQSQKDGRS